MNIKTWLAGGLSIVAIGLSFYFLFHTPTEKAEEMAVTVSEALGLRAGEEVAQMLGGKGRVAVLEMEIQSGQAPTAVANMEMFRKTLKAHGIAVTRTTMIPGGLTALVMGSALSQKDYLATVDAKPAVDAVVSFAGIPAMSSDGLHQYQSSHPPLVVVDIFGVIKGSTLPSLVEQKTIALAFAPRAATEVQQQQNESRIFEKYYKIFRAAAR